MLTKGLINYLDIYLTRMVSHIVKGLVALKVGISYL